MDLVYPQDQEWLPVEELTAACPVSTVVTRQRFSFPDRVLEVTTFPISNHCSRVTETEKRCRVGRERFGASVHLCLLF